jgi:hypothetical protein
VATTWGRRKGRENNQLAHVVNADLESVVRLPGMIRVCDFNSGCSSQAKTAWVTGVFDMSMQGIRKHLVGQKLPICGATASLIPGMWIEF